MTPMATAYEGGAGGKFRRRPLRRASATPYDRPPSAIRGLRSHPVVEEKNGWLSKLVDPASRIIARGASRIFSSVFQKRLAAPPAEPEENHQSCQEVSAFDCTNPLLKVRGQGGSDAENLINNSSTDVAQHNLNSDTNGISELELLLKQKTFTRVEFDRLTELLRSRTIDPYTLQPTVSYEKKGKANVLEQENDIRSIRLNGKTPTSATSLTISEEEFASPAELAKEYMGSRPSKASSSTLSLRNQLFREDALPSNIPYGQKTNASIVPRSVVRFSGVSEPPQNGYMTPRPLGRSAMHRMSCSPFFKAPSTTNSKGGESYRDGYAGPSTSSQWTPTNIRQSGAKRVHKRGSSVLDNDYGSSGPIRRLRQKSNLMSPSKDIHSSLHGNLLPAPSTTPAINGNQGLIISTQKPLGPEHYTTELQDAENGNNKCPSGSSIPVPPRSSEMERKSLLQLDKVATPKEKSSELTAIARDELPSRLTTNMLHERALKSMEDIDSSKFFNLQGRAKLDVPSDSQVSYLGSTTSPKQGRVKDTVHLNPSVSGVKLTETVGVVNYISSAIVAKPGTGTANFPISGSAAVPSIRRPAFQMTAPEDAFDLDDDDYDRSEASNPFATGNVKLETKISEPKTIISETAIVEKSMASSSESVPVSSSKLNKEADMKASGRPASKKEDGFSFPVTPAPSSFSQPPPTPTMPSPLIDRSSLQKEQMTAPAFTFGSKESHAPVQSTTTSKISDFAGVKFNASSSTTTALLDGSTPDKGGKSLKAGDLPESSVNASSSLSTSTSPAVFGFGASTTPSLSNGSLTSNSSTFAPSAAAVTPFSNGSVTSTLSNGTAISTFSTFPSFQFGSEASTGAPNLVSPSMDKSNSTELEGLPVKSSSLSTSSAISPGTTATFSNPGSSSSSSSVVTSSVFSSTSNSSSAMATSPLFSSTGNGSSALSMSSTPSNSSNGIFGFSTSAQPSTSSLSVANSSSKSSTTLFGSPAGSIFGSQATVAGSGTSLFPQTTASQFGSSTSPTFGLGGSSSFGSSSSQLGSTDSGAKPFGSSTVFPSSTGAGSSFATTAASLFSSSSQTSASSSFGSNASPSTGFSFGSSSQPSTSPIFGSSTSPSTGFSFGSSSQPSASPIFGSSTGSSSTGFSFGQSAPTPSSQPSAPSIFGSSTTTSTGFSFGQSANTSGSSSSKFGASSGPAFSFSSAGTTSSSAAPSPAQSLFGLPTPAAGFGSGSPGNDQMNVEDSMTDDTVQAAAAPIASPFGQPPNSIAAPSFMFGSPAAPSGGSSVFQFGGQQNPSVPQSPSPFQAAGNQNPNPFQGASNLEFSGGSFSLGSGGDKSGRKIVRVNRNKFRKK